MLASTVTRVTCAVGQLLSGSECTLNPLLIPCGAGKRQVGLLLGYACALCPAGELSECCPASSGSAAAVHVAARSGAGSCLHRSLSCSRALHAGSYSTSGSSCSACSSGTYVKKVGAQSSSECQSCATGTYGPSAGDLWLVVGSCCRCKCRLQLWRAGVWKHIDWSSPCGTPRLQGCLSACPAAPARIKTRLGRRPA